MKQTLVFLLKKIFYRLTRKALYFGDSTVLTRTIYGQKLFVSTKDVSLAPHLALDGTWEKQITNMLLKHVRPNMNIVEVGANVGFYATLLSSQSYGGFYYAFEANPEVCEFLRKNILINGLLHKTEVINKAVYDKEKTLVFSVFERHHASGSAIDFKEEHLNRYHDKVKKIEIPAISLDQYFEGKEDTIDLIKIDAEGSEPFIFDGMKRILEKNSRVVIFCEFSNPLIKENNRSPRSFLENITSHGFNIYAIGKGGKLIKKTTDELLATEYSELVLKK